MKLRDQEIFASYQPAKELKEVELFFLGMGIGLILALPAVLWMAWRIFR